MQLTLGQMIRRIKSLILAHKQVKSFFFGNVNRYLSQSTGDVAYPTVILDVNTGSVDATAKTIKYTFQLYILDLVNVSYRTNDNEIDVLSDTTSIAIDIISLLQENTSQFEWRTADSFSLQLVSEYHSDMCSGVIMTLPVVTDYPINICEVPIGDYNFPPDIDMSKLLITTYTAIGGENTWSMQELANRTILGVFRNQFFLLPTSIPPGDDRGIQIAIDGVVTLFTGVTLAEGELITVLYR